MLGRPVTRRLLKDGLQVKALARRPEVARRLLPQEVKVVEGDLEKAGSIAAALEGCQAVYVSVETFPGVRFRPETDGLRNVITAARRDTGLRLLVLSAFGASNPQAASYPWWHTRVKHEAQQIAKDSGLSWTIFEPTWFMESLPLFVKAKRLTVFTGHKLEPYWVAGDDYGRIISTALSRGSGVGQMIPVQGPEKLAVETAARRFIAAYDPALRITHAPFWILQAMGLLNSEAKELAQLLKLYGHVDEPPPEPAVWEAYGRPTMKIEDYAAYCRETGDFPQKG
jgi:uncharacterized protein YbjT (DUF2867 family)